MQERAQIAHVIWDWNGTLINDSHYSWQVFCSVSRWAGVPELSFDRFQRVYQHPVEEMYRAAGFRITPESFEEIAAFWHDEYTARVHELSLFTDTQEAITIAKSRGITQHIVSALPHTILTANVARQNIATEFASVTGLSDLSGRSKVANAQALVASLEHDPKEILVIGDSSHDAEVALSLGAQCVLVSCGYEDTDRLSRHGFPIADSPKSALLKGLALVEGNV